MMATITGLRLGKAAIAHVGPGQGQSCQRGGQNEARSGDQKTQPAAAAVAESHGHLGGTRAGQQVACAYKIKELGAAHPFPPLDGLALHHDDVRGRASKSGQAQAQEKPEYLTDGRIGGGRHSVLSSLFDKGRV
jgi:hypothetical protein